MSEIIDADWTEVPPGGMKEEGDDGGGGGGDGGDRGGVDGRTAEELGAYLTGDDGTTEGVEGMEGVTGVTGETLVDLDLPESGESEGGEGEGEEAQARPKASRRTRKSEGKSTGKVKSAKVSAAGHDHGKRSAGATIHPMPNPPHRHFRDDNAAVHGKPEKFFSYLRKLKDDPSFSDRVVVYIYSIWPVLKEKQRQLGKEVDYFDADDLLRKFGCGDYNLKLNDMGANYTAVCQCTIKNVGDRALTEFPPIRNLEAVEVTDPANASYVQYCRSRGIQLPGDDGFVSKSDEESEDMAQVTANEAVRDLTGLVRDLATENKREARDRVRDPDPGSQAVTAAVDVVNDAAKAGQTLLSTAMDGILRMQQAQADPTVALGKTIDLLKSVMPQQVPQANGANEEGILKIVNLFRETTSGYQEKLFQIQSEQNSLLRAQLEALQAKVNQPPAVAQAGGEGPKTLTEQLNEMKALKDTMRDVLGLDGDGDGGGKGAAPGWMEYLPQIIQGITVVTAIGGSIFHNIAVARTGAGTPAPVPPPEQILTPDQMSAAQAGAAGYAPGAVTQYQPQQTQAQAQAQGGQGGPGVSQEADMLTQYHQFLDKIQTPLIRAFNAGESGADFANKLIELTDDGFFGSTMTGRQIYDGLLESGESIVKTLITTHNGIWSVVGRTPAKWDKFLHEFFIADQIWDEEDALEMRAQAARDAQGVQAPAGVPTESAVPVNATLVDPGPAAGVGVGGVKAKAKGTPRPAGN